MEPKRAYSAKGVLTALGKSLLYLLFFLATSFWRASFMPSLLSPARRCSTERRTPEVFLPVRRRPCSSLTC